jgi:hypothetical protein
MKLNVLRDLSLSQNKSLKSADDWFIIILKNKKKIALDEIK